MKLLKNVSILFVIMSIMLMSVVGVNAAGTYTDEAGIVYTLNDNGTATLTNGKNATGEVIIPETITVENVNYTVTSIATSAFQGAEITSVSVPGTVQFTTVASPYGMFTSCSNLETVILNEGINYVVKNMFSYCTSLKELVIPSSVTLVADSAINGCTNLEKVVFEGSDTRFNGSKFGNNIKKEFSNEPKFYVQDAAMAEHIKTSISNAAKTETYPKLYSGENIILEKEVTIDNICYSVSTNFATPATGSATITGNTLNTLEEAVDVVIPSAINVGGVSIPVTSIKGSSVTSNASQGDGAFYKATNLKSIKLPEGITSIGKEAFYGCSNMVSANVPSTVVLTLNSDTGIFKACTKLENVKLADGLNCIPLTMFHSCIALESLVIPPSVEYVANSAFWRCKFLMEITFEGDGFEIVDKNLASSTFILTGDANSFGFGSDVTNMTSLTKFYVVSNTAKTSLTTAGVSADNIVLLNMVLGYDSTNDKPVVTINDASSLTDKFTVIVAVYDSANKLSGNVKAIEYATSDFTIGTATALDDFSLDVAEGKVVKVFAFDTLQSAKPVCKNYTTVK